MRRIEFRQLVTTTLARLRRGPLRRARVRHGLAESLEPRVLLAAKLVKEIHPTADATPSRLVNVNGTLFFAASDDTAGTELWKSDGTPSGTVLVRDIIPDSGSGSYPRYLTNVNGTLFFAAKTTATGYELWKSDGTSSGTVLVRDIWQGGYDSRPSELTNINGTLFFRAKDDTNANELWKSNGTSSGTALVRDINPGSDSSSYPSVLTNVNGTLYFAAYDDTRGTELWKSNGTSTGTVLVLDINPNDSSAPAHLTNVNGTLYFQATDGTHGYELWKSNGTSTGTELVLDILSDSFGSYPGYLTNVNGTLFFQADDDTHGYELWKSNGTATGTVLVRDINQGSDDSDPEFLTNLNGSLYFRANNNTNGYELWRSDGTSAGTVLVRDINEGSDDGDPDFLTIVDGMLYFRATNNTNGYELWTSDGTSAGTVLVRDINVGSADSNPWYLTNVNSTLFFSANDGVHGYELWMTTDNSEPTDITLSATSIAENQSAGTAVGTLSTTDPDTDDTFTYTLVGGEGSTDNASFTIGGTGGNSLLTAASFDFETKSSYSIRVRTTDLGGLFFEKQFTITVTDGNDAATQVTLSNVVTSLLATANTTSAIPLADVSITDDGLGTNSFGLSGADAGVFEVVNDQLRLKAGTVLNYATQTSYSVTVTVDDTTVGGTPDASVNYTLNLQGIDSLIVQNGSVGRSYVRYVTVNMGTSQGLAEAVASLGTATARLRLVFAGTTGTQSLNRNLTGLVTAVGNQLRIDFGVNGVGGDRNSSLGDGIYRIRLDLDGDGTIDFTTAFHRLFGDVDGNGLVNDADVGLVQAAQTQSGLNLATDLNGDGLVDLIDLNNVKRRKGAKVALS
jgi:ELWxxDGT repeat protein